MTEAEWLRCSTPYLMLLFLKDRGAASRGKVGQRRLRLFACACLRRLWHLVTDPRCRRAWEAQERHVEGLATRGELADAEKSAAEAEEGLIALRGGSAFVSARRRAYLYPGLAPPRLPQSALAAATAAIAAPVALERKAERRDEESCQADLLRDVFGNPFRPVAADSSWRAPAAVHLAQAAYGERSFGQLPRLADALEEAGCTDRAVLDHCRGPGPHVRGCWVVDLILGKS
jgi:hypothetical protein